MALFNLLPKEQQYFTLFSQMTSYIYDAARALNEMMRAERADFPEHLRHIKSIEHACDELTHSVATRLNKSFITPFDREDIFLLSGALDDIVDLIDDSARAVVMYDVQETTEYSRRFAGIIQQMAVELHEVVSLLERPVGLSPRLTEIHRLENEGDEIYHSAIAQLFRGATDPIQVIKWKEIYETLEAAIDRCESVANIIESIIIKHT